MRKFLGLSLVAATFLYAEPMTIGQIDVEEKVDTEVIKDVSGEEIKSADLGEALFKTSPSVALVRRSGIANDVIVRGQKKDNINVTIDGTKVCGACPNRMDPPISHVLTNNIDYIELREGPYNVEDFGALSADVKIHTLKPSEEFTGEVGVNVGSWGYKKGYFSVSGGSGNVRFLLSGSTEVGGQYEDGDGNDFAQQIDNYIADNVVDPTSPTDAEKKLLGTAFQDQYRDMDAFEKKTLMAKLFWDITDTQELRLSYTANRSDDILYPTSKMDALYDDSDIFNVEYIVKDLGAYSKELSVQVYQSEVEHPMSTMYRKMALMGEMTHALDTKMQGAKIKNSFDLDNHTITAGLDYSLRNWDGGYYKNGVALPEMYFHSIYDVDTKNAALFLQDTVKMGSVELDMGLRYDNTKITSENMTQQDNDYNELSGYIHGTYKPDATTKYFAGIGKSSRVPDAKELYWVGSPMTRPDGSLFAPVIGTPDLENTVNYEVDIGVEKHYTNSTLRLKGFYSKLEDFIAYNASKIENRYENVDAKVYGVEFGGTWFATSSLYVDYAMAYQRGKKDAPLEGQSGTNMPEIAPFKFNASATYDYDETLALRAEVIAADSWDDFDAENGEQALDGYAVLNLRATKKFGDNIEFVLGVDNVFDKTYAVTNTYKDMILLPTASIDDQVILMNEPGRYLYTNLKYKF